MMLQEKREGRGRTFDLPGREPDQEKKKRKKLTGNFRAKASLERENYQLRGILRITQKITFS